LQILLEVFHLLGSTARKGKNIKRQDDIFLAAVLAQADVLQIVSIEILELEIGRCIADFEFRGRRLVFLSRR